MSTPSKYFRVATEGATTDGRKIGRQQIEEMAASFNPKTYGARIWLEHLRSVLPNGPFKAYGDVVALKAEEVDTDHGKRLALFAKIEPTPELIALNKAKQKMYTSIEINPRFADTGRAYLVGLGVTDTPASLGTEMLAFSAQHPNKSPLAGRKQAPDNLFSAAVEVSLEFEEDTPSSGAKLADAVKAIFSRLTTKTATDDARFADVSEAVTTVAEQIGAFSERTDGVEKRVADLEEKLNAAQQEHQALRTQLDFTDKNERQRPKASGGSDKVQTDF